MSRKRATLKEVAERAGVSIATVSNVFSGRKPVNDDLREKVEQAAKDLSFQIDRAASQLKSGKARVVGVLVPDLDDTFFTSLISRIEVMALKDGYDVIVASSRDDRQLEESRLQTLLGWRPSGIIAVPCSDTIPAALAREVGHLPTVLVDRVIPQSAAADTVTIDNFEAGEIAGRYLVEMGHSDIVLAASHLDIAPIRERVRGATSIVREMIGREPVAIALGSNAERGAEIFAHWLERHPLPSAVFALTNVTTLAVLTALARQRIDIPDQVSIIGFDDYTWMSARKTALTAIRQPVDEIAHLAWERLQKRMRGDASAPSPSILNTSLQVRDSTRRLVSPPVEGLLKVVEEQAADTPDKVKERPNRIH
ncbi:LacI family DNA-binding transcriptional regulator [Neorhizobium galegae]|uniref:HTH-type transcriptional regulator GalR n=2 Tax=Neorhizobium galegae TaxID=399 RepID=A0A068SYV0_NEOGA|nr:LacI family DNA-binding transcriptional regulator [Neorhizobium galegae]CDN51044.1 HTH-type transcriptional regulator GalR [Neorhizobium galegae bv. orientalis str. HAMBI 540]